MKKVKTPSIIRKAQTDDNMKRMSIMITNDMHQWLKKKSEDTGIPMSAWVFFAIDEYITRNVLNEIKKQENLKSNKGLH